MADASHGIVLPEADERRSPSEASAVAAPARPGPATLPAAWFDTRDALETARRNPLGPPETGFVENTAAAWRATRATGLMFSDLVAVREEWDGYLDGVERATGKRFANPMTAEYEAVDRYGNRTRRLALPHEVQGVAADIARLHGERTMPGEREAFELLTPDGLLARARAKARGLADEKAAIAARQSTAGAFGQFLGEAAALMSDPVVLATLPFGAGASASVLRTAVTEALIAGGTEAAIQPRVQAWRAELGLEAGLGQAARNVLLVGAGAGALGAGVKLTGLGLRELARAFDETVPRPTAAERGARAEAERLLLAEDGAPETAAGQAAHGRARERAVAAAVEGRTLSEAEVDAARAIEVAELPATPLGDPLDRLPVGEAALRRKARPPDAGGATPAPRAGRRQPAPGVDRAVNDLADDLAGATFAPEFTAEGMGIAEPLAILRGTAKPPAAETLVQFLRRAGGLNIADPAIEDVRRLGIGPRSHPAFLNRNGMMLDQAAEAAQEQGFFPGRETPPADMAEAFGGGRAEVADLVEALDREVRQGVPQVRVDDMGAAQVRLDAEALDRALQDYGIDLALPDDEIAKRLALRANGVRELVGAGGMGAARSMLDLEREAAAMRLAETLAARDDAGALRALGADFARLVAADPELEIPLGLGRDPATGEAVPLVMRPGELAADLDADDFFNLELRECAGLALP